MSSLILPDTKYFQLTFGKCRLGFVADEAGQLHVVAEVFMKGSNTRHQVPTTMHMGREITSPDLIDLFRTLEEAYSNAQIMESKDDPDFIKGNK